MTETGVRVRMAPGPTGPFHIGRTRTALINWLFARHTGGTFVLRIEDTDRNRSRPEHLQTIYDAFRWLEMPWDEGPEVGGPYAPYFQMSRLDSYREYADRLLETGRAYKCYCTPEELEALRQQANREKRPFRYPGTCRNLTAEERTQREVEGRSAVLRLAIPRDGTVRWDDLILGEITFENRELDDFVIMRANGIPLYNFAVAIDDLTMAMTHVIRGQDHVSNTPRQLHVYLALGVEPPRFGHVPLVVGLDRSKIGARFGAAPLTSLEQGGYLPEAIFNYFATLGTTYDGEREIFSREELISLFDLKRVGKAAAVFDEDKLEWMNGVYIRNLPLEEFARRCLPFLETAGLVSTPPRSDEVEYATKVLALEQERVKTLADTPEAVEPFFLDTLAYDPALLVPKKATADDARRVLEEGLHVLEEAEPFTKETLDPRLRQLTESLGLKTGVSFMALRVAVTGRTFAPPLFETMEVLGRERVVTRVRSALQALQTLE
jgi:glutamyl-tRNA synthetase